MNFYPQIPCVRVQAFSDRVLNIYCFLNGPVKYEKQRENCSAPIHYPVKASGDLRKGIAQSAVETDQKRP
jgi:hypothetical protein